MDKKKILIVDDSPTVRQQVGMALRQVGYEITEATDGLEGIERLNADPQVKLVICDINMPRCNGLELLERVKKNGRFSKLPVVMLTSEADPTLIERAKLAGATGWIIKPFRAELLAAAVRKLLPA